MEIERLNSYEDSRFDPDILRQHGAFVIDGRYPCGFRILDEHSAKVYYHDYGAIEEILENFRFYAGHITRFYDRDGALLREYGEVETFELPLEQIQPSQFYVDREKLQAVGSFVESGEDIVVPVMKADGRYVSLDGHTRLYLAWRRGYDHVRAFLEEDAGGAIADFAREARSRGVRCVEDMEELCHEEYEEKWNRFCEGFFEGRME